MANAMTVKTIVINLQKSTNAHSFKDKNLVHIREFEKVKSLIEKRISNANVDKSFNHLHDTISITGSRGSGKTSFLCTLLDSYKDNNDVFVMDIIDPTLIEEKGHIFLTIISQINERVEEKLRSSDCDPTCSEYKNKHVWKALLRKLADGLPSIDGVGGNLTDMSWQDPEFVMSKGLKSVNAASNLEQNFHKLIEEALSILGKKIMLITLDDIDVDFRRGWPVLETIRKYMTSPRIVTILSGDLRLYSKAIRKNQWKNFGKALLVNEVDAYRSSNLSNNNYLVKQAVYNNLVTEMEGQYLQKVMKPENRIRLTTLFEKINLYGDKIYINEEKDENLIIKYYNNILNKFGICHPSQTEAYSSFLLTQPIRSQVQFLLSGASLAVNPNTSVIDTFLSDLYEKQVEIDLAQNLPKMLNIVILKLLLQEQQVANSFQLQPITTDISLNASLMSLSFLFSQHVARNPNLIFDYLIRIGRTSYLATSLTYHSESTNSFSPSIGGLCNHAEMLKERVLKNTAASMMAYMESIPEVAEKQNGVIYLEGLSSKARINKEESEGRLDYEFKDATFNQKILGGIPSFISSRSHNNESILCYSIFPLLGAIGEIVKYISLGISQYELLNAFYNLSQIRSFSMVSFEKKSGARVVNENNFEESIQDVDYENFEGNLFLTFLSDWGNIYSGIIVSPHVLGRISTRFSYALQSMGQKDNLGESIHRQIIAFMNAVLIEDVKENCSSIILNNNNAIKSDAVFINNLNKIKEENLKLIPFSKWMLACPLLLAYMNPASDAFQLITAWRVIVYLDPTVGNIYASLNQVHTKSFKPARPRLTYGKPTIDNTISIIREIYPNFDVFQGLSFEVIRDRLRDHFLPFTREVIKGFKENVIKYKKVW